MARSTFYYEAAGESDDNLRIMRLIDEQYTRTPFYGTRKVVEWFRQSHGVSLNRKLALVHAALALLVGGLGFFQFLLSGNAVPV